MICLVSRIFQDDILLPSLGVRPCMVAVTLEELLSLHDISHRTVLVQIHSSYAAYRKHFKNTAVTFVILITEVIPTHCKHKQSPPKLQIVMCGEKLQVFISRDSYR